MFLQMPSRYSIDLSVISLMFFFKRKTAYELRISDWRSDVCSSVLLVHVERQIFIAHRQAAPPLYMSSRRLQQARRHADKTGFTRPVGPRDQRRLSRLQREVHALEQNPVGAQASDILKRKACACLHHAHILPCRLINAIGAPSEMSRRESCHGCEADRRGTEGSSRRSVRLGL